MYSNNEFNTTLYLIYEVSKLIEFFNTIFLDLVDYFSI